MKWVLIAMLLSDWNGAVKEHHPIGVFNTQKDCLSEIARVGTVPMTRFVCANEVSESRKP